MESKELSHEPVPSVKVVRASFLGGRVITQRAMNTEAPDPPVRSSRMETTKNLSELLAEARGLPIRFGGVEVRAICEIPIPETSRLHISFIHATTTRPQALRIRAEKVMLEVRDSRVNDAIFWTDTAPREFEVIAQPATSGASIKVWNEWRDRVGIQNAWMGNAGMAVTADDKVITLRCSDGIGDPAFDDLVVSIRLEATSRVIDFATRRQRRRRA